MNKCVGIYIRVSTSEQSTEMQRRELEAYTAARGWTQIKVYEDKATGTNANRPELKRLLDDVRKRKVDLVLIWKLDRLFRSLKDVILTIHEFQDLGIDFISLRDNLDLSTSHGKLMMQIIAAFGEFEASLIKERVIAGLKNAKRKGKRLGRPKKRDDDKILHLREKGLSIRRISKELEVSAGSVQRSLAVSKSPSKDGGKIE